MNYGGNKMKCTQCLFEDKCNLREIAKDLVGCAGHSRARPPRAGEVRCRSCKEWVDKNKAFKQKNAENYCCYTCY
jgi:hypothetical protein